jgi:hypothetical protein
VLIARGFAPTEYVLVKYRDGDSSQQVTKQVPVAAMLEAALAMQAPQAARRNESGHWSAEARAETSLPLPRGAGYDARHGALAAATTVVDRILAEAMKLSDEERATLAVACSSLCSKSPMLVWKRHA